MELEIPSLKDYLLVNPNLTRQTPFRAISHKSDQPIRSISRLAKTNALVPIKLFFVTDKLT